ncbi:MAG: M10 family metallopeptidase C-terminal domain-containing protein [Planctomycetota bacterium]
MENNNPPQVIIASQVVDLLEQIQLTSMFTVIDPDENSEVTTFFFRDNGVGGGRFLRNNSELAPNVWHQVSSQFVSQIVYEGAGFDSTETFSVRVEDGLFTSNLATGQITSGNASPVVQTTNGRVAVLEDVAVEDFFTVTDANNDPIVGYFIVDRDNSPGGGRLVDSTGQVFPQAEYIYVLAPELSTIRYRGAVDGPRSEQIGIIAFDGFSTSEVAEFTMRTTAKPTVTDFEATVLTNQPKVATEIFTANDNDGDPIQFYIVNDYDPSATSGFWSLNGVRQNAGSWFVVQASELDQLTWTGGSVGPVDELVGAMAFDGFEFGEVFNFTIRTVTPPEVDGIDSAVKANHYLNFLTGGTSPLSGTMPAGSGPVVTSSDADGDPIERYLLNTFQTSPLTGQFYFDSAPIGRGQYFSIAAADLGRLEYRGGSFGEQINNLGVLALANNVWSEIDFFNVTTLENEFAPDLTAFNATARLGTVFGLSSLFTVSDQDGDIPQTVRVFDTGVSSTSGFVTRSGIPIPAGEWHEFAWEDLSLYQYNFPNQSSNEILRFQISDGVRVSTVESSTLVANPTPTIEVLDNDISLDTLENIAASQFFIQTDGGLPFTRYQVYDSVALPESGSLFLREPGSGNLGENLQQGIVHTLTAEEFSRLDFEGAESDFGRSIDPIIVRATNDVTGWSEWQRINVNSDPVGNLSVQTGGTYFDQRAAPGEPVVIEYTFIDGDPGGGPYPPMPNYYVCRPTTPPAGDAECSNGGNSDEHPLTQPMRATFREVVAEFESIFNVDFVEVDFEGTGAEYVTAVGLAVLETTDVPGPPPTRFEAGWAYQVPFLSDRSVGLQSKLGDIWFERSVFDPNADVDVGLGSQFRESVVEGLAKMLGLGSPNRPTNPLSIFMEFEYNSVLTTINDNNFNPLSAHPENPSSLSLYDVVELQNTYGANTDFRTGDDHYGNFFSGSYPHFVSNEESHQTTIWDAGGVDVLNYTFHVADETIDLREGQFSTINGEVQALRIAYGTQFENARGGSGSDTIIGNEIPNLLFGNDGNDVFTGNGGNDVLRGGAGDDTYNWSLGDGFDLIREEGNDGVEEIKVFNATGDLNEFRGDISFSKQGNSLYINLRFDRLESQGAIWIQDMGDAASQVELLAIHDQAGNQIGNKLDLLSVWATVGSQETFYQITNVEGDNGGFLGVPA